jgi:hypothetical protein
MKTYILFTTTLLVLLLCWGCKDDDPDPVIPSGPTEVAGGPVSGTWKCALSPYMINGDIWVPDGETLSIEPCVEVVFTDHFRFDVHGQLLAEGTKDSMILFTAEDSEIAWNGLRFLDIPQTNDSSKLVYCKIQFGSPTGPLDVDKSGGGIGVYLVDKLLIAFCEITENRATGGTESGGGGIAISSCSPVITNNSITNNIVQNGSGGGILISGGSSHISNNLITNNSAPNEHGGGIMLYYSNSIVTNNVIFNNTALGGGGIAVFKSYYSALINNTIIGNTAEHGGGLDFPFASGTCINTIVYGNSATDVGDQVHLGGVYTANFINCDIEGGLSAFGQDHKPGCPDYNGRYENNIDAEPEFLEYFGDFLLKSSSPCIEAGINMIEVDGTIYHVPSTDYYGNPRPAPDGSSADIGAIEFGN